MTPPDVIITMAGTGQRFRDAGYTLPKFRLEVHGKTLFEWAIASLGAFVADGARFVFVPRRADDASAFVRDRAAALGIVAVEVFELDHPTDGQATTALLAGRAHVAPDRPIAIYNIDTHVAPEALPCAAIRGDGWIPVFPGDGDGWSFVRVDDATGRAVEVREKRRVSPHCTVGLYHFGSLALFEDAYHRHYAAHAPDHAGERYVAPIYNQLIADGREVRIHEVPRDAVVPLGTPAEVDAFRRR